MPVRVSIHCWVPLYKPSLSSSLLDRAEEESGKRKREDGDDMAALEAAVTGTRLQGFVSGGTVQPDQRTQDEAAAAVGPGAECTKSLPLLHLRSKGVCDDVLSFQRYAHLSYLTRPAMSALGAADLSQHSAGRLAVHTGTLYAEYTSLLILSPSSCAAHATVV